MEDTIGRNAFHAHASGVAELAGLIPEKHVTTARVLEELMIKEERIMDRCSDCRHCHEGYCDIYGEKVNPNSSACSDFEER